MLPTKFSSLVLDSSALSKKYFTQLFVKIIVDEMFVKAGSDGKSRCLGYAVCCVIMKNLSFNLH
jgi:hypothetical protein